jgi:hypothetical protein
MFDASQKKTGTLFPLFVHAYDSFDSRKHIVPSYPDLPESVGALETVVLTKPSALYGAGGYSFYGLLRDRPAPQQRPEHGVKLLSIDSDILALF